VTIAWDERQALLQHVHEFGGGALLVDPFVVAGASRPVELDETQRLALLGAITMWQEAQGVDELPDGVLRLRRALLHGFGH
jgi:hypothetical protein